MASSSNITNPLFSVQITEKLNKSNHVLWQAQVITAISSDRLEGHITGKTGAPEAEIEEKGADGKFVKVSNPAYEEWFARDQQILGFLFMSDTKDILTQIAIAKTAAQAWSAVEAWSACPFNECAPHVDHNKEGINDHHRVLWEDESSQQRDGSCRQAAR